MIRFERIEHAVTRFAAALALIGGMGLIFATIVTCTSIILKLLGRLLSNIFGSTTIAETLPWMRSILGEEELVTYGVGSALFAALPWVMIQRGHIKIDLFMPLFGRRFNRVLDLVGDAILAALAYLIMTRQWYLIVKKPRGSKESFGDLLFQGNFAEAISQVKTRQLSQILEIPLWPTYIVAEICVVAFFAAACFCVWRSGRELMLAVKAGA